MTALFGGLNGWEAGSLVCNCTWNGVSKYLVYIWIHKDIIVPESGNKISLKTLGCRKKTEELDQSAFKNILTSDWKAGNVLSWGRGLLYIFTVDERIWDPSKLIKVQSI